MVEYGLTSIVYPLIHYQFSTHCPSDVLEEIHKDIYGQKNHQIFEDFVEHGNTKIQKRIKLTQNERQQLFPPNSKFIT